MHPQSAQISDNAKAQMPAVVHSLQDGFIYSANSSSGRTTRRHPGVLLLSNPDTPLTVHTSACTVSGSVLAVAPRVMRQLTTTDAPYLAVHVEPAHKQYKIFEKIDGPCGVKALPPREFSNFDHIHESVTNTDAPSSTLHQTFADIVDQLAAILGPATARDPRMEHAINITRNQAPEDYCFQDILDHVGLSAGRFSHLFTDEVGLPLRSFLIWKKTKDALNMLLTKASLTEIAHDSGFSDSAHFCRTFQNSLGIAPSSFRGDRCIQVRKH